MAKKIRDIVVKVGEYTDNNTGETKARWQNVGSLMKGDDDAIFIVMDRTFSPAGVSNPDNRSNVLLSCFTPKPKDNSPQGNQSGGSQGGGYDSPPQGGLDHEDDPNSIPF